MTRGKGGGPKTAAGKAITRLNAVKHGLTALSPVVEEFESEEEWAAFSAAIIEDQAPEGPLQYEQARRIAELQWRMRRMARAETAEARSNYFKVMSDVRMYFVMHPEEDPAEDFTDEQRATFDRMAALREVPSAGAMEKIAKHETHLSRQLHRALWEMRLLKDHKRKEREENRGTWVEVSK